VLARYPHPSGAAVCPLVVGEAARVAGDPVLALGEVADRVQRAKDVADRLGGEAFPDSQLRSSRALICAVARLSRSART